MASLFVNICKTQTIPPLNTALGYLWSIRREFNKRQAKTRLCWVFFRALCLLGVPFFLYMYASIKNETAKRTCSLPIHMERPFVMWTRQKSAINRRRDALVHKIRASKCEGGNRCSEKPRMIWLLPKHWHCFFGTKLEIASLEPQKGPGETSLK